MYLKNFLFFFLILPSESTLSRRYFASSNDSFESIEKTIKKTSADFHLEKKEVLEKRKKNNKEREKEKDNEERGKQRKLKTRMKKNDKRKKNNRTEEVKKMAKKQKEKKEKE